MDTHSSDLYKYLVDHALDFTEDWLKFQNLKSGSHYSPDSPTEVLNKIKEQNSNYVKIIAKCLLLSQEESKEVIYNWTRETAAHRSKSNTSLDEVVRNSGVFRRVYWTYVEKFVEDSNVNIPLKEVFEWERKINFALDYVLETFTSTFLNILMNRLQAQSTLIKELSTPVISLTSEVGLLPIIGDIDTTRARTILESTLQQSAEAHLSMLIIDLSGVVLVDTMVAQQIFHLIDALNLLGVKSVITGIRPEVAQTAIHLGLDFSNIHTENSLERIIADVIQENSEFLHV
ncbi:STAS domain-containing protein [Rossellomorea aquimaris]|jgi:rsbT co-antagonist protein RsbR|uniref:STAS domain-containing protein n=1 Tax=Rossellomorea aquimaris TaxID=189382 RepID=A0A5D4UK30_9BACI|nr:STAS domain-containing protein [Rossellomorea aquimaris]TYS81303.1 STAS domain-containing protein [Rossellomorea aquimaris]TYS87925.1 STAS domain-containing protein [Rossellomorea aquimaris]